MKMLERKELEGRNGFTVGIKELFEKVGDLILRNPRPLRLPKVHPTFKTPKKFSNGFTQLLRPSFKYKKVSLTLIFKFVKQLIVILDILFFCNFE